MVIVCSTDEENYPDEENYNDEENHDIEEDYCDGGIKMRKL